MWDGGNGAHFGVLVQAPEELLSDFPPRDEFGKVLLPFGEGLFAQGSGCFRCFSGWVGSIEDGGVDFFSEPVFGDVHGTAVSSALFEGWSEGVLLCDFARVH